MKNETNASEVNETVEVDGRRYLLTGNPNEAGGTKTYRVRKDGSRGALLSRCHPAASMAWYEFFQRNPEMLGN